MKPDVRKRMTELCQRIQTENDPKKFTQLIYELNVLLESRQMELNHGNPPPSEG